MTVGDAATVRRPPPIPALQKYLLGASLLIASGLAWALSLHPPGQMSTVRALCPCHVKSYDDRIWNRIFEMVDDCDLNVRRQVFHALGDGSPRELEAQVVAVIETFTQDPDAKLKRRARKLLASYRGTGKINVL